VRITASQIIFWCPCNRYPDGRVRQLVPGQGLTPLEIAALDIPHADRVWVLLRPEVLEEHGFQVALDRIAVRTVTNHALHCGVPVVEGWAQRWLDGTDRTEAPAKTAARAEARSAWAAAWAARAADAAVARSAWAAAAAEWARRWVAEAADAKTAARTAGAAEAAGRAAGEKKAAARAARAAEAAARATRGADAAEARSEWAAAAAEWAARAAEAPATGTTVPATRWLPLAGFLGLVGDGGGGGCGGAAAEAEEHMLQLYDIVHVLEGRP
jgi:hypothetical protein